MPSPTDSFHHISAAIGGRIGVEAQHHRHLNWPSMRKALTSNSASRCVCILASGQATCGAGGSACGMTEHAGHQRMAASGRRRLALCLRPLANSQLTRSEGLSTGTSQTRDSQRRGGGERCGAAAGFRFRPPHQHLSGQVGHASPGGAMHRTRPSSG